MTTTRTRPTGATVRTLDVDALNAAIAERYPDVEWKAQPRQALAIEHGPDQRRAVVCNEGVGWVENDGNVRVLISVGAYMTDVAELPVDVVVAAAGEEVDLSTVVRQFGARLETNFGIWFEFVTGKHTWEVK